VKLADPVYVSKMAQLDKKITSKQSIRHERKNEIKEKSTHRLIKMYVSIFFFLFFLPKDLSQHLKTRTDQQ
jgi:hypothetical protein